MLTIIVPANELYDEKNNAIISTKETKLVLEHSLVSISKWESKWCKPFISNNEKTVEEIIDYIKCMTLTQNVDDNVYLALTSDNIDAINRYIDSPMTATWFNDKSNKRNRRAITSEVIYYWMVVRQIPVEFQKWHLNRLLTLIKVYDAENSTDNKMSKKQTMSRYRALNEARKKKYNTNG